MDLMASSKTQESLPNRNKEKNTRTPSKNPTNLYQNSNKQTHTKEKT
jgi:hypothetical protein